MQQLPGRSATHALPPAPRAGIPPDPIERFAGRDDDLEWLHDELQHRRRMVISGLGGIGKTQLAVQYLHRHRSEYRDGCFWLRGDESTTLRGDLASLAWHLRLPQRKLADEELVIEAVFRWLRARREWLLVIDNVDEPPAIEAVRNWFPPGLPGCMLVTSRSPLWSRPLELIPLSEAVAADFLVVRTGQEDRAAAAALATRLAGLPLALEQAAAYLEETNDTMASYLRLLDRHPAALLAESHPADHAEPVARTWDVSFRRVEETSNDAADLLRLCAFLAPDDIPIDLLGTGAATALPGDRLSVVMTEELELNRAIGVLRRYSLITRAGSLLRVHRLVQEVLRESLQVPNERAEWAGRAVRLLQAVLPPRPWEPAAWPWCQALLPHALSVAALADECHAEPVITSHVMKRAAGYLRTRAAYDSALPLYERCLAIREEQLGAEHPETIIGMNNLALLLQGQGKLAAARHLHERALEIRERTRGPKHSGVAVSLNNLGLVLLAQGDLSGARQLLERALAIREEDFGPNHRRTAIGLSNLGEVLEVQGELAAATRAYKRALAIREEEFGPNHYLTGTSLSSLGGVLATRGDLVAARRLHQRALEIQEKVYGPDHQRVAISLAKLALVLQLEGDLVGARGLYERALAIQKRVFGPNHRRTAIGLSNLGEVLLAQGDLAGARRLHECALTIREQALGPDHHRTAASLANLADVLRAQGELTDARRLHERALAIREKVLTPEHHLIAASLSGLGEVLWAQGELTAAQQLHKRALAIRERVLGPDHPATAASRRLAALP